MILHNFISSSLRIIFILISSKNSIASSNEYEKVEGTPQEKRFLSTYYSLTILALNEEPIYQIFKNHSNHISESIDELTSYLEDYESSSGQVGHFVNGYSERIIADHPFLAFRMLRRFRRKLTNLFYLFNRELNDSLKNFFNNIKGLIGWPTESDIQDAITAILRIHHVYDPNLEEFVRGNILGKRTPYKLQALDCYEIAKLGMSKGYYANSVEWVEAGISLILNDNDQTLDLEFIEDWHSFVVTAHDLESVKNVEGLFYDSLLGNLDPAIPRLKLRNKQVALFKGNLDHAYNDMNFWALCSGDDLRTEQEKANLFCWYETKTNPAWTINPLKLEQLSQGPDILQFYDIIPDGLIERIIQESQPHLKSSEIFYTQEEGGQKQAERDVRTATSHWINDTQIEELRTIGRRIELATNLVVTPPYSSEILQVASYTFGGHYILHPDGGISDDEITGDRTATFMLYLNDVEAGGYTAFPQAGIAAKPVKGSGVFWYNLKKNGEMDMDSWHAACPVVLGHKWISNKWIRSRSQFLSRPCTLNPEE